MGCTPAGVVAPPYLCGAYLAPSVNDNLVRSEFSSPGLAFCTFPRNTLRTPASLIFNGKARYFPHRSRSVYVHRVRCISRYVCTFAHLFAHTLEGVRYICFTQVAAGSFGTFPRRSRNAFYHAVYRATVFGLRVGVCTLALYTRLNRRCTTLLINRPIASLFLRSIIFSLLLKGSQCHMDRMTHRLFQ